MEIIFRTAEIKEVTLTQRLFQDIGWFLMQPNSLGGCEQCLAGIKCNLIFSGWKLHWAPVRLQVCILPMKGEVIFPNPIVLLKFPIMKQTHLAILCPSVDNWTRIFALSLPTYLTVQVIYLGLRQKVSTSHLGGWRGDAAAQHSLPCPASSLGNPRNFWSAVFCWWLFVGLSFCLVAWQGNGVKAGGSDAGWCTLLPCYSNTRSECELW